ncbi:hypothetical protein ACFC26_17190 [Kitasatospora purpeofusca]|uniref:hypothetical protein n=1 Tax=Kitasatospora purpeofusca TaxID=67352 RepID=UPI0035D98C33
MEPADFQRPLAKAYRAHAEVLSDLHELAAAARANLPDSASGVQAQESIAWATLLLGQAEIALREAALSTCPDAGRLATRQR